MALNVVVSVLGSVLDKFQIDNSKEIIDEFKSALEDCGIKIDEWRDAYYQERIPKPMSSTSMAIQLKNFEVEVLQLRNRAWNEGAGRKERLMSSFEISSKKGHTVLVPKTRNAQLVLANSVSDFRLSNNHSDVIDDLIKRNDELTKQIEELKCNQISSLESGDFNMPYQLQVVSAKVNELSDLLKVCEGECLKLQKRLAFQEEETEDRIAAINTHHEEEKKILKREINRLNTFSKGMLEYNNFLETQHERNVKIISGLAARANLLVDDSHSDVEADDSKEKTE
ncbi:non-structural protein 3 [Rotavirus B]|uniref:Non-structural protein 3 n=1 Tax=Rotavirus B TaxID=28876 RepID=A0A0F6T672_9REOV|nr:non-structural protein 3 [Rotavirus B]